MQSGSADLRVRTSAPTTGPSWSQDRGTDDSFQYTPAPGHDRGIHAGLLRSPVDLEIVIPAYNEEGRIRGTVNDVTAYLERQPFAARIVVVNNASVDRTNEAVDSAIAGGGPVPVTVIGCSRQGKGAAVRRGILTSSSRYVGFCDADQATPIDMLDAVLPVLHEGYPVVIGSRHCPGGQITSRQQAFRRLGGWAFRQAARTVVPGLYDTQCGFKFFAGEAARRLFAAGRIDGFAFDLEILSLARDMGYPIAEVPVRWSNQEGSTFRLLRDGLRSWANVLDLHHGLDIA